MVVVAKYEKFEALIKERGTSKTREKMQLTLEKMEQFARAIHKKPTTRFVGYNLYIGFTVLSRARACVEMIAARARNSMEHVRYLVKPASEKVGFFCGEHSKLDLASLRLVVKDHSEVVVTRALRMISTLPCGPLFLTLVTTAVGTAGEYVPAVKPYGRAVQECVSQVLVKKEGEDCTAPAECGTSEKESTQRQTSRKGGKKGKGDGRMRWNARTPSVEGA